jgi:hypothetical protein
VRDHYDGKNSYISQLLFNGLAKIWSANYSQSPIPYNQMGRVLFYFFLYVSVRYAFLSEHVGVFYGNL